MSVKTAEAVIRKFLSSEGHETLALTGAWGVGKTFIWNKLLRAMGTASKPQTYAYVSLFGIASVAQLRTTLMLKAQPIAQLDKPIDLLSLDGEWHKRMAPRAKAWGAKLINLFGEGAAGKGINYAIETLAPFMVKDILVCLDDFERLKAVTAEEILGLISELKEERGCKVILIFNAGELAKKPVMSEAYASYKEKVIDIEVDFAPTPLEAFDLAFEPEFPNRSRVALHVHKLRITNIRILRKIRRALSEICVSIGSAHPKVIDRTISTTALLCWCAYAPEAGKPRVEDIANWNHMLWGRRASGEAAHPEHETWVKQFKAYGFHAVDELDIAIGQYVQRGYIEDSGVPEAAEALTKAENAHDLDNEFTEAWNLFHNSFGDNAEEFIRKVVHAAKRSAALMNTMNLDSTVRILRNLSAERAADDLIDFYVETHRGTPEVFDSSGSRSFGRIQDEGLKKKFVAAHEMLVSLPTLEASARFVADHSGWNPEHVEAMNKATVEDFYAFFMADHGHDLSRLVKACLTIDSGDSPGSIGAKAKEALARIGALSTINAERVSRYGV